MGPVYWAVCPRVYRQPPGLEQEAQYWLQQLSFPQILRPMNICQALLKCQMLS